MKVKDCESVIVKIQKEWPEAILSGSAALILQGTLPERAIHDLDFCITRKHFDVDKVYGLHESNGYNDPNVRENQEPDYTSYEVKIDGKQINFLVYEEEQNMDYVTFTMKRWFFKNEVKVSKPGRIIAWKRRYNRPKDRIDLAKIEEIAIQAIEDELL